MKEIPLGVSDREWKKIYQGRQSAVLRMKKLGKKYDYFHLANQWWQLTKVEKVTLEEAAQKFWYPLGYKNPEQIKRNWRDIVSGKYAKKPEYFWIHFFRPIPPDELTEEQIKWYPYWVKELFCPEEEREMGELYTYSGEKAGLYDVCRWWLEKYPEDIFAGETADEGLQRVVRIREEMKALLKMRGEKDGKDISTPE